VPTGAAAVGAALAAFVLRGCAIQFRWSIPPIGRVD
ncbi:MAG TPA: trimeric intracellular cation channel family protein, partial [Oceanicaulis sp.]|nr:trimeric intracellular cation channel family protein [Oceanicaulis sp.]